MKMQARARSRYLRMSPKKMRQVADLVKGRPVEEAINILQFTPKAAAHYLYKTVKSAAANAISSVGTAKLRAEDLSITNIMVDAAPTAKRVRFQSMGRVHRIKKRYCHLTVEIEGEAVEEEAKAKRRGKAKAVKVEADETPKETKPKVKRAKKKAKEAEVAADEVVAEEPKTDESVEESSVDDETSVEETTDDPEEKKSE